MSKVPFETTLQLLDAADALPSSSVPVATPEELAQHLQAVRHQLGRPLSPDQAKAAVATLQDKPNPARSNTAADASTLPYAIGWDRPASEQALDRQRQQAQRRLARAQRAKRRFAPIYRSRMLVSILGFIFGVSGAITALAGLCASATGKDRIGIMVLAWIIGMLGSLVVGILIQPDKRAEPWWDRRRSRQLERVNRAEVALGDLSAVALPVTLADVKRWMAVPGLSRHLYALTADPVPFLAGDVRRLDRGLKRHEAALASQAEAERRMHQEAREAEHQAKQAQRETERAQREREAILTFLAPQAS